jgi:DNA-binding LytR/AlgR family response regulator
MKAIIIEDEKLSAEHLATLISKIDTSIEIVGIYESVKQGIAAFSKGIKCDLIFADIHLADGLSFEIFSKVIVDTPVIFTTAYDEYAIKAFKLNSVDYLLKPIGISDLKSALEKFKKLNKSAQSIIIADIAEVYQNLTKQHKTRFMVKMGETIASIKSDDITHFISEEGVVLLVTNSGKRYITDYTLDNLEEIIAPETFFRINRKVILNINYITKVSTYFNSRLKISTPNLIEDEGIVSRERVNDFKSWLDK